MENTTIAMRKHLKESDVTFTVEALFEYDDVRGNAMASGDDAQNKKVEDEIISQLDNGNQWAWCTVKVTAHWKNYKASDYLGHCSYDNEEDFIKNSCGYYEDMKITALEELNADIQRHIEELSDLMDL